MSRRKGASRRKRMDLVRTGGFGTRFRPGFAMQMPAQEMKFHDISVTNVFNVISSHNPWNSISPGFLLIPAGTGASERLGRRITVKSILIKGSVRTQVQSHVTILNDPGYARLAVILDTQANGATAAFENVWNLDATNSVNSQKDIEVGAMRFKILMDRTKKLRYNDTLYDVGNSLNRQGSNHHRFTYFKKCNIPVLYNGVTGAVSELVSTNILGFKWWHSAQPGTPPVLEYTVRIRFVDN